MSENNPWPKLEKLLFEKQIPYVDYSFARHFIKNGSQEHGAFFALLFYSARSGHYCLQVREDRIFPEPLWLKQEPSFRQEIIQSLSSLPTEFFCLEGDYSKPLVKLQSYYYLQRNYLEEGELWHHLQRISQKKPCLRVDQSAFNKELQTLEAQKLLTKEQASAVSNICKSCFTLLLGGPGTGKTYTAARFLELFMKHSPKEDDGESKKELSRSLRIVLASPTGKAAAHLLSALKKLPEGAMVEVKTLHALLKRSILAKKQSMDERDPLLADFCIVDESSMMDLSLMKDLFTVMKSGSRLLLLGDQEQLSPVQSGSLLRDLQKLLPEHCAVLSQCLRTESKSIISLSKAILAGVSQRVFSAFLANPSIRMNLKEKDSEKKLVQDLDRFSLFKEFDDSLASHVMTEFEKYRILSPLREGSWGVERINTLFLQSFQKRQAKVYPIMITRNDYRLELFNGQTGLLVLKEDGTSYALFKGEGLSFYEEFLGLRKFDRALLSNFDYAYCLSIHKSQGSEFDYLSLLLPQAAEVFDRQLLYTAVTRARKSLSIAASDETITALLKAPAPCISGLLARA